MTIIPRPGSSDNRILRAALRYRQMGIATIPLHPSEKRPTIKWKHFQEQLPTYYQINEWFSRWPTAGLAFVLGHGLCAIDVDGQEAHHALLARLGQVPETVRVKSGNPDRHRYHLLFQHPAEENLPGWSTAWHEKLEFRFRGSYVVAPPTTHKSGNQYCWYSGRKLGETDLAPLPAEILNSVIKKQGTRGIGLSPEGVQSRVQVSINDIPVAASRATRDFLSGLFANTSGWNNRLFRAACDLAGLGIDQHSATSLLLAGAEPWNESEEINARNTIESAYSQDRTPSRLQRIESSSENEKPRGEITLVRLKKRIRTLPSSRTIVIKEQTNE